MYTIRINTRLQKRTPTWWLDMPYDTLTSARQIAYLQIRYHPSIFNADKMVGFARLCRIDGRYMYCWFTPLKDGRWKVCELKRNGTIESEGIIVRNWEELERDYL